MDYNNYENVQRTDWKKYSEDFMRTLSNFCMKSPLQPKINYVEEMSKVYLTYGDNECIEFDINPMEDKKDAIKQIKNVLQKDYPVIYTKKTRILPSEEIEKLVEGGMPLSKALEQTTTDYMPKYRVMRVHHYYNELDCFDLQNKVMYKFHAKLPVTAILEEIKMNGKDNEGVIDNLSLLYRMDKKS